MTHTKTHSRQSSNETLDTRLGPAFAQLAELSTGSPAWTRIRNQIVSQAIPLADKLARRFANRGEPTDDLTQVARLALIKAVNNFDPTRGTGFTRFAVPSILGELKRHFRDRTGMMRVPRPLQESRVALHEASETLSQRLDRTPTDTECAEFLSISVQRVRDSKNSAQAYHGVSLDQPCGVDGDEPVMESVGGTDTHLNDVEDRTFLNPLTKRLSRREQQVLSLRYGRDLTQTQIASRVGLSQMHISRLLRHSLSQLREDMRLATRG